MLNTDYEDYVERTGEDPDSEQPAYDVDEEENRKKRITNVKNDVERAKSLVYADDGIVMEALERVLKTYQMDDEKRVTSAMFKTDLQRNVNAICRSRGIDKMRIQDHTFTPIARMAATEMPDFLDHLSLSSSQCDLWVVNLDSEKYGWIRKYFGYDSE